MQETRNITATTVYIQQRIHIITIYCAASQVYNYEIKKRKNRAEENIQKLAKMKDCYYRVWSRNNTQYCWGEIQRELLLVLLPSKYSIWADQIMQKWQPTNSENCQFSNYQKIERRVGEKAGTANVRRQFGEKNEENRHLLRIFFFRFSWPGHTQHPFQNFFFTSNELLFGRNFAT